MTDPERIKLIEQRILGDSYPRLKIGEISDLNHVVNPHDDIIFLLNKIKKQRELMNRDIDFRSQQMGQIGSLLHSFIDAVKELDK